MGIEFPLLAISRLRMGIDGAGVTTLIAGAGCPLRCEYCINKTLLRQSPKYVSAQELLEKVRIDDLYFQATGGGVTFGGGESLLHAAFLLQFRGLCPNAWKINAETSLNVPLRQVETALPAVDTFIVDVKTADPEIYRRYTRADPGPVWDNLRYLLSAAGPERVFVRVPRIPGYTTEEKVDLTAEQARSLGAQHVQIFDYVTDRG